MSSLSSPRAPWWQLYVLGGMSAMCGELASFPLDLAKTRRQLAPRGAGASPAAAAGGGLRALPALVRAAGLSSLYSGASAALLRQATYGSLRLGGYEALVRAGSGSGSGADAAASSAGRGIALKMGAGVVAGFCSALACAPCDVVKVRMQASAGGPPAYAGNVLHALAAIARSDGVAGLYAGALPTALRAAVVAAAEIALYDEAKGALVAHAGAQATAASTHVAAALLAGLAASAAASPVDVVKSRWIAQRARYSSLFDVLRQTLRAGGARALWAGFPADFARRGPHTVVTYSVLEQLRNLVNGRALVVDDSDAAGGLDA